MRIISKIHDYYDGCMSTGVDRSILYLRDTKIIDPPNYRIRHIMDYEFNSVVIGFCGKLYPCIYTDREPQYSQRDEVAYENTIIQKTLYTIEDFKQAYEKSQASPNYKSDYFGGKKYIDHFDSQRHNGLLEVFQKYNVPIFIKYIDTQRIVLNPRLQNWNFMGVFDSWSAYQEISMFVSGVLLGSNKPVPTIDDVTLAECKGFNKFSFRKDKTK